MRGLILILLSLAGFGYVTELGAEDWRGSLAPFGAFLSLIALALWLVLRGGMGRATSNRGQGGGWFWGDGGDGGCD